MVVYDEGFRVFNRLLLEEEKEKEKGRIYTAGTSRRCPRRW